jgi:hypothetical protein
VTFFPNETVFGGPLVEVEEDEKAPSCFLIANALLNRWFRGTIAAANTLLSDGSCALLLSGAMTEEAADGSDDRTAEI